VRPLLIYALANARPEGDSIFPGHRRQVALDTNLQDRLVIAQITDRPADRVVEGKQSSF
jgi:hypothetical protein